MIVRSPFVVLRNDNDYFIYFITLTVGIKKRGVAPRSNVSYLSVCQINQVAATDPGVCMRELRKNHTTHTLIACRGTQATVITI